MPPDTEAARLADARQGKAAWKKWGPYLADRAWGTVREDYSATGEAWDYFPHDHARSRCYRWNEDGLLGICDDSQYLCFALACWNRRDAIVKERLFGLSGTEGNHGEDVKDVYFFLDSTPTHSYMKALYKYPQAAFPYEDLVRENRARGRTDSEYELTDTGIFEENRYFDIFVEYAKAGPDDILIKITAANRGPESAPLDLLPTLWFRNTWSWAPGAAIPELTCRDGAPAVDVAHLMLPPMTLYCDSAPHPPELLFTNNETNFRRLYGDGAANCSPWVKDGINDHVVAGSPTINPSGSGTRCAARYALQIEPGAEQVVRLRLSARELEAGFGDDFDAIFEARRSEADDFYASAAPPGTTDELKALQRQAFAGLLWSKQFYYYNVHTWLTGDPAQPSPPASRWYGRNHDWQHIDNKRIMSMPDAWEYPWYAAWDLAFHTIPLALIDSEFAKNQLILLLREWYMHPSGQAPAYEWAFGDANPPVHAWAAMRVFQIDRRIHGTGDRQFLERVFHKLLINFTWWVNRKDRDGRNVFQGGFLGLDNIGLFDRGKPLPGGGYLDQSDGTSWMAMYCLNMLAIALELASEDPAYEDVATKFLEHFFYIAHAMNDRTQVRGDATADLWDEEDGFYYDVLHLPTGACQFMRIRSLVGLIPLLAVETMEAATLAKLPDFNRRLEWFLDHRNDLCASVASVTRQGENARRLFSVVSEDRLRRILDRTLSVTEFLSEYGIRSLSAIHRDHPFSLVIDGVKHTIDYEPAESTTGLFGGNSNWRGPIWFPINYLLIEALQKFDYYYGQDFKIECPTGSGTMMTLWEVSIELQRRLTSIFLRGEDGARPVFSNAPAFEKDLHWRECLQFFEYFHGDTGAGLGASHQTGWTALVAKMIQQSAEHRQ